MPQKYGLTGKQSFLYVTRTLCYVARMKNVLIFIKERPKMLRHLKCVFRNNRMKLQNRHIATALPMWQTVNSYLVRIRYFVPWAGISRKYAILVRFPQYHLTVNHICFRQKVRKKTIQTKPKESAPAREAANR